MSTGVEWYLISKIDKFEVESPVRAIIIKGLGISSGLILLIGVAAFIMARKFTRPIIEDMEFAQAISEGKFEKQIELDQKDELGQLADALNRMARELYEIDWMKNGKEGLHDALRGDQDDQSLAQRFISFIVKHLNAQIGAVYQWHRKRSEADRRVTHLPTGKEISTILKSVRGWLVRSLQKKR